MGQTLSMEIPEGNSFSIGGIKVQFPGKPYPSQLAMMNKGLVVLVIIKLAIPAFALGSCDKAQCNCGIETKPKKKVPKIWFGTRTHKQIGQIARELGKTDYKHTRMSILSSREHTCIHPQISSSSYKNDECKALREGPGCRFHEQVKRAVSQKSIASQGLQQAWQLEEFVTFCLRNKMDISLKGEIVILDEGHNIEDACREAASYTVQEKQLTEGVQDLQHLIEEKFKPGEHGVMMKLLQGFVDLIGKNQDALEDGDQSKVWGGMEMIAQIESVGIGAHNVELYQRCLNEITEEESDPKKREEQKFLKAKSQTLNALEGLLMVIKFALADNHKHADDYRCCVSVMTAFNTHQIMPSRLAITKTTMYIRQATSPRNGWLSRRKGNRMQQETVCFLNFWCLNPAVAFGSMGLDARSVILTSGTLSPMTSFQSELGASFPIQLEANHVISPSQVWVGTISHGPKGGSLLGSYQNSETLRYQDEIGELILHVCQIVPDGVLCFLPSYKSLQKLADRWKNTGLWAQFMNHKQVFSESRASDKENFDEIMKNFYDAIHDEDQEVNGGLFFAVCRGKVSEGMDFSDRNARAVIAIGIPFPNYKDAQVELKQKYNNMFGQKRGLLSGRDWYEIQAYRALNQALGRCIRHSVLNSQRSPTQPFRPSSSASEEKKPEEFPPLKPSYKVTGSVRAVIEAIKKIAADVTEPTLVLSEEKQLDGSIHKKSYVIKPGVRTVTHPVKAEHDSEDLFSDTQCSLASPMTSTQVAGKATPLLDPLRLQREPQVEHNRLSETSEGVAPVRKPLFKPKIQTEEVRKEEGCAEDPVEEAADDFACLKTYRTKRRNSSFKNSMFSKRSRAKAVEFIDDSDDESDVMQLACPKCGIELASSKGCNFKVLENHYNYKYIVHFFADAVKESFEPFFWKNIKSSNHTFSSISLDAKHFDDRLSVLKSSHSGLLGLHDNSDLIRFLIGFEMNSQWQEGVLVQFMACAQCVINDPSSASILAALVVMTTDDQKRLRKSQVWLLPECLKT
ncbi:hypothetical protein CAPTEDRAFT_219962 [Capitella teleta]|uniref:DNA 5'-3' helicase n=1 Tax=Capitella teleta TaxID=283909 RepID=R7T347_CAPTE|nr:hypothetical protein CAPTEDRAFT_219962 [Capitella teleta]|eukprot:ELT86966.1 hypothetical protein CAPTEDRAFT_219962 [Capitella teleta]